LTLALYLVLKKPAREFFRKRSTHTRLEMEKAKKYYNEAEHKYKDLDVRLKLADTEARKLIDSLKHEGELEKRHIITHAQELAKKIQIDSTKIVQQEVKKAQEILKAETVNLAADLASKHIQTNITAADQTALSGEFVTEMEKFKKAQA
jgi:F-type H+-transporting ATPase subunit b